MKKIYNLIKKIDHIVDIIICIIVSFMVIILTILNWIIAVFSIVDILYLNLPDAVIAYKAWGIVSFTIIFISHSLFHNILYNTKIRDKIISWIKSRPTNRLVVFTLGYITTYFLDLYYVRNKYDKYNLLYHHMNDYMSVVAMFPILNILCYIDMIRSLRKHVVMPSNRELIKLYLKGQLMTYIIREYDDYDL